MRLSQTLNLRISEIRQRLNEINVLEGDDFTTEVRSESEALQTEFAGVEVKYRSAVIAESDDDDTARREFSTNSEDRELRQLIDGSSVGGVFAAAMESRKPEGQTAELQAHFQLPYNSIPLDLLRIDRGVEERAAATVPASIGDAVQAPVITPVFASGDGDFLGIERPTVAVGTAAYPLLSTVPSVKGPFEDSTEAAQTDATFVANSLVPERLQASFSYLRSDAARFAGLDASLRLALNSGLQEALDKQAISGTDGLLTGANLDPNNVNAVTTFQLYLSGLLYGRVDGRYARTPGDVRMIVGQGTFAHAALAFKGNNSDESGVERLQEKSGGMVVSSHVPPVAANKQNALIRLGMERGAAVQPMWNGVSLVIEDKYTRAAHGELIIHAVLLANFAITRKAQWSKRQTQHA